MTNLLKYLILENMLKVKLFNRFQLIVTTHINCIAHNIKVIHKCGSIMMLLEFIVVLKLS